MERSYHVYILTNSNDRVIYIGVTNDLRRLYEHQNRAIPGFAKRYNVHKLVYFEQTNDISAAITREKELKSWRREKRTVWLKAGIPSGSIWAKPSWNESAQATERRSLFCV